MNSLERHEIRYQRRKEKRNERKHELTELYGNFENSITVLNLIRAYYACRKNVRWKASVQVYGFNLYKNSLALNYKLLKGIDTFKGFYQFEVIERGKKRNIRSIHISERCIEKALAKNSYLPILSNSLIYDNSASLKGRGTDFARKRILTHLRKWYRHNKNNGYVLVGDFTNFFDSINHTELLKILDKHFEDKRFVKYTQQSITHYGEHGLGLGSELNQLYAVSFPNKLDQYIKTNLGVKYYHRYNDDFYILCETKEEAKNILSEITKICNELSITIADKKTHISPIRKGFTFLKKRYTLTNSGYVIIKHNHKNIVREIKKLKTFKHWLSRGTKDYALINQQYQSWRGYLKNVNSTSKNYSKKYKGSYKMITSMDKLYNDLFIQDFIKGGNYVYST